MITLRNFILVIGILFTGQMNSIAQNLWQPAYAPIQNIPGEIKIQVSEAYYGKLNFLAFQDLQKSIPAQFTSNAPIISLPNPDGILEYFQVFEQTILPEKLAAKYPNIKTYTAINIANKAIVAKIDYTNFGFHAMVNNGANTYFIDPVTNINSGFYMSYYKKHAIKPLQDRMQCMQQDEQPSIEPNPIDIANELPPITGVHARENGAIKSTYRLALACTGEYANAVGGATPTKASVLSAMVTSVNRVSGIYELEYATHLNLIEGNDTLIFMDGSTDPYTNNSGGTMLGQNKITIDSIIGIPNYDIGHVFSTGGGGIASLASVCNNNNKARGVTGSSNPVGDPFDVDYVAHEMGHQFGGSHTFDALTSSCSGNRSSANAYEVGSGTTIQAYAGICGVNNVQPNSDPYFSIQSLNQMSAFITTNGGSNCSVKDTSFNKPPIIPSISKTYNIPYLTYFEMDATASDADNDPISYCWEQFNRTTTGKSWNANFTVNPLFRSFSPTKDNFRIFPDIKQCLKNQYKIIGQRSPDTTRKMTFKLAVRDVHNGYGSFSYTEDSLEVFVHQNPELFRVTSQDNANDTLAGLFEYDVQWQVAGTDTGIINTPLVDIFLSTDSGYTYTIPLATAVPNDGLQKVKMPNIDVAAARIKVKGLENIFFDLNDQAFAIKKTVFPTGIRSEALSHIIVYPNPVLDNIQIQNITATVNVKLLNSFGQLVYSGNISKDAKIDLQNIPSGIYSLHLQLIDGASKTIKIIKQ